MQNLLLGTSDASGFSIYGDLRHHILHRPHGDLNFRIQGTQLDLKSATNIKSLSPMRQSHLNGGEKEDKVGYE